MKAKQQAAIDAEERLYAEAAAKEEAAAAARAAREEATRKRLAEQAAAREAELARLEAAAAAAERKALGLSAAPAPPSGGAAAPGSARQAAIAKATIGGGVEQYATDRGARAKPGASTASASERRARIHLRSKHASRPIPTPRASSGRPLAELLQQL